MDGNRLKWQNWDMHIGYNVSLRLLGEAFAHLPPSSRAC